LSIESGKRNSKNENVVVILGIFDNGLNGGNWSEGGIITIDKKDDNFGGGVTSSGVEFSYSCLESFDWVGSSGADEVGRSSTSNSTLAIDSIDDALFNRSQAGNEFCGLREGDKTHLNIGRTKDEAVDQIKEEGTFSLLHRKGNRLGKFDNEHNIQRTAAFRSRDAVRSRLKLGLFSVSRIGTGKGLHIGESKNGSIGPNDRSRSTSDTR